MSTSFAAWCVVVLALAAANMPFLTRRVMGLVAPRTPKGLGVRILELLAFYFLTGASGLLLESHAGQIAPQTWEFYAITATLFVTFAFPGFVYRYLVLRKA